MWRHPEIFSPTDVASRPPDAWSGWPEPTPSGGSSSAWPGPSARSAGPSPTAFGQGLAAARKGFELAATLPTSTGDELRILAERAQRTARSVADQVVVAGGPLSPLMVGRSLARRFETETFDLDAVRRAARALGAEPERRSSSPG